MSPIHTTLRAVAAQDVRSSLKGALLALSLLAAVACSSTSTPADTPTPVPADTPTPAPSTPSRHSRTLPRKREPSERRELGKGLNRAGPDISTPGQRRPAY